MIVEFTAHVEECLKRAFEMYDIKLSPNCVTIKYNLKGKCAGQACKDGMVEYRLRFNREAIENHWDGMVQNTIPHEVAHLVAWMRPELKANGHNTVWKRICIQLGGTGARTHSYKLTPAHNKGRGRRVHVYNVNGQEYKVGVIVHNRIQRGRRYKSPTGAVLKHHYIGEVAA